MSRDELIYSGPADIDGTHHQQVEFWKADGGAVVAVDLGSGGSPVMSVAASPATLTFDDEDRLVIEGSEHRFVGLRPRSRRGTWGGQSIEDASGATVHEDATVEWSDQGVTIVLPNGDRIEYPGARTTVQYGIKRIEPWSGDPAERLTVVAVRRGCGRCGGGRR